MSEESQNNIAMPDAGNLMVSSSPHLHGGWSVPRIMCMVMLALLPACLTGVYYFGIDAVRVIVLCVVFCVLIEFAFGKIFKTDADWRDGSAALTGLLLAMNLNAGVPWWLCLVGCGLAIILGKQLFGGLGHNPFNPALVARVGLLIGFPKLMTTWMPTRFKMDGVLTNYAKTMPAAEIAGLKSESAAPFMRGALDGVTTATPLGDAGNAVREKVAESVAQLSSDANLWDYFCGNIGGCLGETSVWALTLGGVFLIFLKLIRWQVPAAYIGTVAILTGIINYFCPTLTPGAMFHVLTGGLFIGAFFMATDMVTSPMTGKGALVFGIGCGVVTTVIRVWGNYPEGVSFSIIFMNGFVPLIDRWCAKQPFGSRKQAKEA